MIFDDTIWADHLWTSIFAIAAILAFISSVADRRRQKRTSIEDVGFMPWTLVTVLSMLLAVVTVALAIKTGELF